MSLKIYSAVLGTGLLFAYFIFLHGFQTMPQEMTIAEDSAIHLWIPAIHVDVTAEPLGLTPAGAMDAPKEPLVAGWYDGGPRPGKIGSAVIDGHYGWKNGQQAVFDHIHDLKIGDRIYSKDGQEATSTFIVRTIKVFNESSDAAEVFHSYDTKAHLNLITCEGIWDSSKKSYSGRLVVFADKE